MFQSLSLQLFILDSLIGDTILTFFVYSCYCIAPRNLFITLNLGQEYMTKKMELELQVCTNGVSLFGPNYITFFLNS
uniref:Uncharacterized protein n=1 Tax=Arundo donax TaxID=35708 RepID=A0A0A9HJ62_ARUDO